MLENKIPSGYIFEIITWENDADNYKTNIFYGLSKDEVILYKTIADAFYSGSNNKKQTFGNCSILSISDDKLLEKFNNIKIPKVYNTLDLIKNKLWILQDAINTIIGVWGEGERYRVTSNYSIKYSPLEIILWDVDKDLDPIISK